MKLARISPRGEHPQRAAIPFNTESESETKAELPQINFCFPSRLNWHDALIYKGHKVIYCPEDKIWYHRTRYMIGQCISWSDCKRSIDLTNDGDLKPA